MGGGSVFPTEMIKGHSDDLVLGKRQEEKQIRQDNRKRDRETNVKWENAQKEEAKKENEVMELKESNVEDDKKQQNVGEVAGGRKEKIKSKREHREEGKEKRKEREGKSKEHKDRKERTKNDREGYLEVTDGKVERKDVKKRDEKEKRLKGLTKEAENVHIKDETLDKKLEQNGKKDKARHMDSYKVEKLKKKLAKLDAKLEKIVMKRIDYLQRLKESEGCGVTGKTVDCESQESNFESLANDIGLLQVSSSMSASLPESTTKANFYELPKKYSDEISYPKIEEKEITGAY